MGFLMGAMGKLQAGKRMRNIQYQQLSVQRRLRQVTNELKSREKMWTSRETQLKNQMTAQCNAYCQAAVERANCPDFMSGNANWTDISEKFNDPTFSAGLQVAAMLRQNAQAQFAQMQTLWQQQFEAERDADLQGLKDIEESLNIEKDNLESQLKLAQQDYESMKDMEKQGAQNLKPDYTGQA